MGVPPNVSSIGVQVARKRLIPTDIVDVEIKSKKCSSEQPPDNTFNPLFENILILSMFNIDFN